MSTRAVRFEFDCELARDKLNFVHDVPARLVDPDTQTTQNDPRYVQAFVAAIQPILVQHQVACRAASKPACQNCGSPTTTVLQTPMSWLHLTNDPFVRVWVNPVCGKPVCEFKVRQEIQDMMALIDAPKLPGTPTHTTEVQPCKVCNRTDMTLRCARCLVVSYCGKEHQKADWKVHKIVCAMLAGQRAGGGASSGDNP